MEQRGGRIMIMVYLLFAISVLLIHFLAGYDSRYQRTKYIRIENKIICMALIDSMSAWDKTKRPQKDRNKMSLMGIFLWVAVFVVVMVNVLLLIMPDIPIDPWGFETEKFLVSTDTLNEKVSAISIFLLFLGTLGGMVIILNKTALNTEQKWVRWLIGAVNSLLLLLVAGGAIYFVYELILCFV